MEPGIRGPVSEFVDSLRERLGDNSRLQERLAEVHHHLVEAADEYEAVGLSRDEAEREALRAFGEVGDVVCAPDVGLGKGKLVDRFFVYGSTGFLVSFLMSWQLVPFLRDAGGPALLVSLIFGAIALGWGLAMVRGAWRLPRIRLVSMFIWCWLSVVPVMIYAFLFILVLDRTGVLADPFGRSDSFFQLLGSFVGQVFRPEGLQYLVLGFGTGLAVTLCSVGVVRFTKYLRNSPRLRKGVLQ